MSNKVRAYIYLFILTIILSSCNNISDPTLSGINRVKILKADRRNIELEAEMTFHNPNSFSLDLEKAEISAYIDEIELAKIDQTYESSMPAKADFDMPFRINLNVEKLYEDNPIAAVTKGLKIMSERKLMVHFKGNIGVGKGKVKVTVPIDREEEVSF